MEKENQLGDLRDITTCIDCGAEWEMLKGKAKFCPGCGTSWVANPCNYTFDEARGLHSSIRSLRERVNALEQVTEAHTFRLEKQAEDK